MQRRYRERGWVAAPFFLSAGMWTTDFRAMRLMRLRVDGENGVAAVIIDERSAMIFVRSLKKNSQTRHLYLLGMTNKAGMRGHHSE
jgi:hypothetical protein